MHRRHYELEEKIQERTSEVGITFNPVKIARELKDTGHIESMYFEEASFLSADFKGFTSVTFTIPGKELAEELDEIFKILMLSLNPWVSK